MSKHAWILIAALAILVTGCEVGDDTGDDDTGDDHTGDDDTVEDDLPAPLLHATLPDEPPVEWALVGAGLRHTCAVDTAGAVACWGDNTSGECDAPEGAFSVVSGGYGYTCGISGGEVLCWGDIDEPPEGDVVDLVTAYDTACVLDEDGTIACWGDDTLGQASPPAGAFEGLSGRGHHLCALDEGGEIACWGLCDRGQCDAPPGPWVDVAASEHATCAVDDGGAVSCWGAGEGDDLGQLAHPDGYLVGLSAGYYHTTGITSGSMLVAWGLDDDGQATPPAGSRPWRSVTNGIYHSCAIDDDGLFCWGCSEHDHGQCAVPAVDAE